VAAGCYCQTFHGGYVLAEEGGGQGEVGGASAEVLGDAEELERG